MQKQGLAFMGEESENVDGAGEPGRPVVVLGYGAAAVSALFALREGGYTGPITVVNNAAGAPYSPVLTSYYAAGTVSKSRCFPWSNQELACLGFEVAENAEIVALHARERTVHLADGRVLPFSACLIATGAHPVAPGFPQTARFEPLVLRTMQDAERLKCALEDAATRDLLVSGTSMVGLKAMEACLCRGKRVTLLGRSAQILRGSAHPSVAQRFERRLKELGVSVRLNDAVAGVSEAGEPGLDVTFARDGATHRYDHVILAQGVAPNIHFVNKEEIATDRGILVDSFMRTSSPNVYAAGDVAQALDLSTGERKVIALWTNAVAQGRVAGHAMAAALDSNAALAGNAAYVRPFRGSIPCNTIHVASMLYAAAGSVAEGDGIRIETEERDGVLKLAAYRRTKRGEKELVGFNMLAEITGSTQENCMLNDAGVLYWEIMNRYR